MPGAPYSLISDISKLTVRSIWNCTKVNVVGYVDDLVLVVAPPTQTKIFLLNALISNLSTLLLQLNVQKSCNIDFTHNKKMSTSLTVNNLPLRQVTETTYLWLVLTDDLSCGKDVERAKLALFKKISSIYPKLISAKEYLLLLLFWLHAM